MTDHHRAADQPPGRPGKGRSPQADDPDQPAPDAQAADPGTQAGPSESGTSGQPGWYAEPAPWELPGAASPPAPQSEPAPYAEPGPPLQPPADEAAWYAEPATREQPAPSGRPEPAQAGPPAEPGAAGPSGPPTEPVPPAPPAPQHPGAHEHTAAQADWIAEQATREQALPPRPAAPRAAPEPPPGADPRTGPAAQWPVTPGRPPPGQPGPGQPVPSRPPPTPPPPPEQAGPTPPPPEQAGPGQAGSYADSAVAGRAARHGEKATREQAVPPWHAAPRAEPGGPVQVEEPAAGAGPTADGGGGSSSLLRSGAVMAIGTLASRVTGFLRTAMLVAALGTGALADAYNTANTVPFIVYDLLLGGILTAVVVPLIVRARERDPVYGARYEQRLLTLGLIALALITVVAVLLGQVFIDVYGGKFEGDQRSLAILFARLFAVQIFFLGASALAGAVLNTRKRFGAPMWAPVLNNIVICAIAAVFLLVTTGKVTPENITSGQVMLLASGTIGGIILQTVALWPALRGAGFRWRPRLDFHKGELSMIARMGVWTLVYVVITQVGFAVTTRLANSAGVRGRAEGVGDVGYTPYFNAYQLFQLPYAIIAVSVITALLPRMSEHAAEGRLREVRDDFSNGLRLCSVIIFPAAGLMAVLAPDITTVLFAHGNTAHSDALVIANVLRVFAIALVPFSAFQLMLRVFYSLSDTRTPAFISVLLVASNIGMALAMYTVLPTDKIVMGIAIGFGVANTVAAIAGWAVLRRRLGGMDGRKIARTYLKLIVAIWPLLGFAYATYAVVDASLSDGTVSGLISLVVGSVGGGLLYLLFARLLQIGEIQTMLTTFTRRLPGRR